MRFWKKQPEPDIWDKVLVAAQTSLEKAELDQVFRDALSSIVTGGVIAAANALDQCQWFRRHREVNFEQAIRFVEVFAMAMVSRWLRVADKWPGATNERTAWEHHSYYVLSLFDNCDPDRYEEAWLMHLQFKKVWQLFDERKNSLTEAVLVLCLAARALGIELGWKLTSPPIPAESTEDLVKAGYTLGPSGLDALVTFDSLAKGATAMFECFKRLQKSLA